MMHAPVLIIGAGGKTGRRVAEGLRAKGLDTRPASRSTKPAFDWNDPTGWADVLKGAKSAYVTFQPDIAVEGSNAAVARFCEIAKAAGVEHLVLLSGRGEPAAQAAERVVVTSGMEWNVVRASWFNQNFDEGLLLDAVMAGDVSLPVGSIREPFVDVGDVADVAVAALTNRSLRNRSFEVTGPRAITFGEAVSEIAKASGRKVVCQQISTEVFLDGLRQAGLPEETACFMKILFEEVLDGRNVTTTNGVEEALGRKPKDFSDYAREAAENSAWSG